MNDLGRVNEKQKVLLPPLGVADSDLAARQERLMLDCQFPFTGVPSPTFHT